jgi:putative chitinase
MDIQIVNTLFPRAASTNAQAFAAQSDALFARHGIAPGNRLLFFLAQLGHESGGLTVTRENLNYSAARLCEVWPSRFPNEDAAEPFARNPEALANAVYANRMGNGAADSGDGFRYRGRGYIQITGRDAYRAIGDALGLDLEGDPDLAFDPEHALSVVCGFWSWKRLNPVCDTGDFVAVTKRINGGTVGLADRRAWLDKVRRALAVPPAPAAQPAPATVIAVQRALQELGFGEIGAADGIVGPRTLAGIARFRAEQGLAAGAIDAALLAALGLDGANGP